MKAEPILGLLVVIFATGWMIFLSYRKKSSEGRATFRRITAINRLRSAVGLSVEDGSRVHISLGNGDLNEASNPSGLAGVDTLQRIGQLSSVSDQPPVCTSGNGGFTLLSKDVLRMVAGETQSTEMFDADHGRMAGATPFAYVLGTLEVMNEPAVRTNVFMGSYGAEVGFLTTAAEENGAFTLAASDSIVAQSVFLATAREVMLGEELYAVPAYLVHRSSHVASLKTQDLLRLIISGALLLGLLLKLAGIA